VYSIATGIGTLCWAIFFAGFVWSGDSQGLYTIEVFDHTARCLLHSVPASPGEPFTLKYIHSVEKTPVYEVYTFDEQGRIFLIETTVESCGYGLPTVEPGNRFRFHEGKLTITDLRKKIDSLVMRVSYLNDMMLTFRESDTINLPRIAAGGDRVEIHIRIDPSVK
jgi:hypothetical protein